jgi:hypothetical protein
VQADATGWLALLGDGRLVASVTEGDRCADAGESPDGILRALNLLDGAEDALDHASYEIAYRQLNEWIARDWTRRSSGLAVAESPMRRRMRRALDDALRTAPRHRRARAFDRATTIRRALARPLPLGLERALDALVDTCPAGTDWLDAAARLAVRAPGSVSDPSTGAPRCRVLIVFERETTLPDGRLPIDAP